MACLLTQGYNFAGCKGGVGGIDTVYLTEFANVTALALTANVYTTVTMSGVTVFRKYVLDEEMGMFDDPLTYSKESGTLTYEHQVDFTIKGLTVALKAEIKLIAQNKLIMMVKDRNGLYWMAGPEKGMDLVTVGAPSGKKMEDFNGFNLSFRGKSSDFMHTVNSALIAALAP